MSFNVGQGNDAISEINVTPLVDVMLVLLVIFMITATLIQPVDPSESVTELDVPVTRYNDNVIDLLNTDKLVLRIDAQLRVFVGEEAITDCSAVAHAPTVENITPCLVEIGEKLGQNAKLAQDREIFVLADTNIPFGFVSGALAQIRGAGVDRVGLITNPDYDIGE